jgi:hypothetical protein
MRVAKPSHRGWLASPLGLGVAEPPPWPKGVARSLPYGRSGGDSWP